MMKQRRTIQTLAACAVVFTTGRAAHAFEVRPHLEGAAAHFLALGGGWQSREIGPGMIGTGALELAITRRLGLEGRLLAGRFLDGSPSADPSLRHVDQTGVFGLMAGLRWQPLWDDRGLWLGGAAGTSQTGGMTRAVFDARVGWDFRLAETMRGGPFFGYFHVVQPNDTLRPEDGRVAMLGLHVAFDDYQPPVAAPIDSQIASKPAPHPVKAPAPPKPPAAPVVAEEVAAPEPPPPAVAPAAATVAGDEIVLGDRLYFEVNSAAIKSESRPLLQGVAKILLAHPEIELVEIQGHTDDIGTDAWNQKLSESRAVAVRNALVEYGVAASRLQTRGFGKAKPLTNGVDEAARRQNRRVEFVIERRNAQ